MNSTRKINTIKIHTIKIHRKFDMFEFVRNQLKQSDFNTETVEGFEKAYDMLIKAYALIELQTLIRPSIVVDLDSSPESYAIGKYLTEFALNMGDVVINNNEIINSVEEFNEGRLIVVL